MYRVTKQKVHGLLHPEIVGDSRWDKFINAFIILLIFANVVAVMLHTVPSLIDTAAERRVFDYFEIFSVMIFTVEYVLRVWSANHEEKYKHSIYGRLKYMVSPGALIDLIAILPFYIHTIVGLDLRMLRILRLLRFFRLFRLTAYMKATKVVVNVFRSKFNELMIALVLTLFLLIIAACLLYFAEHNAQPDKFSSIPATMWWAIVSLTTVGYGDMYPVTILGKIFTGMILLAGVAMLALPAGIITSGFLEEIRKVRKPRSIKCPHCGRRFETLEEHET